MTDQVSDPVCEAVYAELAEIALGIMSGRRRSEVFEHVELCERCSSELERLSGVADALLQLAPELEAPLGFELRVAERLQSPAMSRDGRHGRRIGALVAAALLALALGFGVGAIVNSGGGANQSPAANLTVANLASAGHNVGEVMISLGSPGWMFMTIDAGAWSGKVTCQLTLSGGRVETVGVFDLSHGYGSWGAPLRSPASEVRSARLVSADGAVIASATFRA